MAFGSVLYPLIDLIALASSFSETPYIKPEDQYHSLARMDFSIIAWPEGVESKLCTPIAKMQEGVFPGKVPSGQRTSLS